MRSAWTLVEVLVAMGIILVLAGLAMPWIAGARGAGARSVCQQQMASHLVTIHAYTNDYRDVWPFALPRGFGTSVQPDLAPPSNLGWYEATPAMWFMALKDEYGEGASTASLLCPADRQTEAERARLAAARGVPIGRVAALTPRALSLALYLDPAALDPERPEWHPRHFRVTRRARRSSRIERPRLSRLSRSTSQRMNRACPAPPRKGT